MPSFSQKSLNRLKELRPELQEVLREAIKDGPNFTIVCAYRGKKAQEQAVAQGTSKLHYPNSPHNSRPARAVDVAPYPVDWDNIARFRVLVGYIMGVADARGVELRSGMDWNENWDEADEVGNLRDFGHLELKKD